MAIIKELQKELLEKTLWRIKKYNPEYAKSFNLPDKIETYEELAELPFLDKGMLRDGYPFKYLCADKKELARMHMSSGSTGTPIINPMTANDVKNWGDIVGRCMKTVGMTSEDTIQITPTFGLFNGGFGFHYGAENVGAFIVPASAGRSSLQLSLMKDMGVTVLGAIASYPLRLIEIAREKGFDFSETSLRLGIFGAEVWSSEMRDRIEKAMGIKAYDIIGMTETGGVGMGIDCPHQTGIHVWDDYLFEIIDPVTLKPVEDGVEGELVVTTLNREGLPLIRYRTSDITTIVGRDKCACGHETARIAKIKGRTDDMLKLKGINFYPTQVESVLMNFKEASDNYLIVLEDDSGKNAVTIVVESDTKEKEKLSKKITEAIYDMLAFKAVIELVPLGALERKDGKAKRVIDKR